MRVILCTLSLLAICCIGPSFLHAQEPGSVGIIATALGSTSVGVIWHVSSEIAIRPAATVSNNSTNQSTQRPGGPFLTDEDGNQWNVGGEIDLNYYLAHNGALAPYLVVGGGYSAGSTMQDYHERFGGVDSVQTERQTSKIVSFSAGLGVQYVLAGQLHLVAEVTAGYRRTTNTVSGSNSTESNYRNVNGLFHLSGASIGAIFYFK
ncbi:MAG TPA: hypothetical protein VHI13_18565 [Candidatus Kapabacteria bacterium]|nr:hypothetical protein [Candidatus Kapabacteria bacterium]